MVLSGPAILDCIQAEFNVVKQHALCRERCEYAFRDWCDAVYRSNPVARQICHNCVYRWIYDKPCHHGLDGVPVYAPFPCGPCLPVRELCAQYEYRIGL